MKPHLEALQRIETRLSSGDAKASVEFWELVKMHGFQEQIIGDVSAMAISFVDEQIRFLKEKKEQGINPPESAKEALKAVLDSLEKKIAQSDSESKKEPPP